MTCCSPAGGKKYENGINRGEENSDISTNELVGLGSDLPITCQIAFSSSYVGDIWDSYCSSFSKLTVYFY